MDPQLLQKWRRDLEDKSPVEVLQWADDMFGDEVTLATALGLEAQVITHLIARNELEIPIFTLDTGRLFDETYALLAETESHYNIRIKVFFPEHQEVQDLVNEHGTNLFRDSFEKRKRCCAVRKVNPLRRALAGKKAWIAGLRRDQAHTREKLSVLEWDEGHGLLKINPLIDWSERDVWSFIRREKVPYNALFNRGFASIGCAPCTRAIEPGEEPRAGRWWWEASEHKECGIHVVGGKVMPNRPLVASLAV